MNKVLIIGAQNIDLYARSKYDLILHDSNKSKIHMGFGGVGCNIATNLSILGNSVSLLTVFGDDYFSQLAKQNLTEINIDFSESRLVPYTGNSVYLGVMDKTNDLFVGLNDMDILDNLNPAFFNDKCRYIETFDFLVIDNNLSRDALVFLLNKFRHKSIIMDAVSSIKAGKLNGLLHSIDILKLNMLELNAMSNKPSTQEKLNDLLKKGVSSIILTNSEHKIIYISHNSSIETEPIPMDKIENATGAGDAFLSGFVHALIREKSTEECLEKAKKVAHSCLQSPYATIQKQS